MKEKNKHESLLTGVWRIHNNKKIKRPAPIANFYVIGKACVFNFLFFITVLGIVLSINNTKVYADTFYPSGDSMQC